MRWLMILMVGGTLVLAVGSGASVPTATEGPVEETVAMAVSAAGVEAVCTVECNQGAAGGCEHEPCNPEDQNEQLAELLRLLEAGDLVAVSILAEANELVEVAWEEGLLAMYQCPGRVSGTIALAGWELQSLASASVQ